MTYIVSEHASPALLAGKNWLPSTPGLRAPCRKGSRKRRLMMDCSWRFLASLHSQDNLCLAAQGRTGLGSFTTWASSFHPQALDRLTFATEQSSFHSQLHDYVGPEMSMNALLPRTLTSQVCGRVQLQCLRPLRIQGLLSSSPVHFQPHYAFGSLHHPFCRKLRL